MNIEPIGFYELARASHIKRWHIVNTANQQNLAEHHYNVTVIGLELHKRITSDKPTAALMAALLFHDAAEIRYGDIPTPGKAFMRKTLGDFDGDFFEHMDSALVPELPYTCGAVLPHYEPIIKLADLIEAAWWIRENGVGHHAAVVADKCWRSVVEKVAEMKCYDEANYVLTNLGMPYISPASQVNQL